MQKSLIIVGVVILLIGVTWPWLSRLPFGKLPGDLIIDQPKLKVFFPITSMILISAIVSLLLWWWRK